VPDEEHGRYHPEVADGVAIISVVASSTVAMAAVAAQIWQGHLTRESDRRAWLRDRRAEAYLAVLRLFVKTPDEVTQPEWEQLTALVYAYATPPVVELFVSWGDASRLTWQTDVPDADRTKAYQDAGRCEQRLKALVASELQGVGADRLRLRSP
jgi:hypothetical protein